MIKMTGSPADPGYQIKSIFIWISINRDGGEGIIAADLPVMGTIRYMPLMSSKREIAESMRPRAEAIREIGMRQNQFHEIELREFVLKP